MLKLEKTDPRTRKLLLQKSLGDLMSEKPVDTSAVVNADPILRSTPESTAIPEVTPRLRPSIDEVELNTVEKNVSNKTPVERDADIDSLSSQLDALKINQEPLKLKFADEAEVKRTKEELDEAITDFINCRNGR